MLLVRCRSGVFLVAVEEGARLHQFVDVLAEHGVLRLELAVFPPDVADAIAQVLQGVLQFHDLKTGGSRDIVGVLVLIKCSSKDSY